VFIPSLKKSGLLAGGRDQWVLNESVRQLTWRKAGLAGMLVGAWP
jgi:hypothetical protein